MFNEHAAKQQAAQTGMEAQLIGTDWSPQNGGRAQWALAEKKLPETVQARCALAEPSYLALSVRQQSDRLNLNRAQWAPAYYYVPATESPLNLQLMRLIDEQYMQTPFYGWPRMTVYLQNRGYAINHKRVQRLMHKMGMQALYPKPSLSNANPAHNVYPYWLRNLAITHPNQVWSTDITYLPMPNGFIYLVAVIDWFSRYVAGLAPFEYTGWCLPCRYPPAGIARRTTHHL